MQSERDATSLHSTNPTSQSPYNSTRRTTSKKPTPKNKMSPLLLFLLLIPLSTPLPQTQKLLTNHTPQQRPTRTLGSLFGSSKPSPTPPQPPQQLPSEQKSLNAPQYVGGSGVRPLVYQVKYYDRVQNNLIDYPDPRNYNAIDKAGVNVEQPQGLVQGLNGQVISQPPIIPPRYYYNPLIPPIQEPIVYTLANIGNTQVLIPCSSPSADPYVYDSTIALNVEQPQQLQQPSLRVPVTQQYQQQQPPVPTSLPNRTPILPPSTVQQPLIREQVVAAAAELSALNALPGSGIVGANINSVPYTQGSYFYYYLLPGNQQDPQQLQIQPQIRYQQPQYQHQYQPQVQSPYNPFTQFINPYTRYNQNNVIPVVLTGYPNYPGNQQVIPQPSNVNQVVNKGQQGQTQVQGQTTQQQQQQQQQQVKG